jgi:hypothetical protein
VDIGGEMGFEFEAVEDESYRADDHGHEDDKKEINWPEGYICLRLVGD